MKFSEFFKTLLFVLGLFVLLIVLTFSILYPITLFEVRFFNKEMGTDYTTMEWMFGKDVITRTVVGDRVRLEINYERD